MNKTIYAQLKKIYIKSVTMLSLISPTLASKWQYRRAFGKKLDLKNPQTLNAKLMYLKLKKYWKNKDVTRCADKYEVRKYIEENGCGEILTELYGCWDDARKIDWDSLPNKFAIKCNHGSGYNLICTDKTKLDIEAATKQIDGWMNEMYGAKYTEHGIYQNINRRIVAESFIETKDGLPPYDYKFFCSYGEVKFLFVASDRYEGKTKFDYYWPNGDYIPVKNYFPNDGPKEMPETFDKMKKYAEILSKRFPIVRVDFYTEGGKIYFGELTFTHFGCLNRFEPEKYDEIFGACFPPVEELAKWE